MEKERFCITFALDFEIICSQNCSKLTQNYQKIHNT